MENLLVKADEIKQELIQNMAEIKNDCKNILILGDFNRKTKLFKENNKKRANGLLLDNLVDVIHRSWLTQVKSAHVKLPGQEGPRNLCLAM